MRFYWECYLVLGSDCWVFVFCRGLVVGRGFLLCWFFLFFVCFVSLFFVVRVVVVLFFCFLSVSFRLGFFVGGCCVSCVCFGFWGLLFFSVCSRCGGVGFYVLFGAGCWFLGLVLFFVVWVGGVFFLVRFVGVCVGSGCLVWGDWSLGVV